MSSWKAAKLGCTVMYRLLRQTGNSRLQALFKLIDHGWNNRGAVLKPGWKRGPQRKD